MRKLYLVQICLLFWLILAFDVMAEEQYACVQYQREDYSWSDPYKVPGQIVTGRQMLEATNDFKYKSFNNYALVKWPNGGYSALEMPSFHDEIPFFYTNTKDQNGRTYRIKKGPDYGACTSY